MSETELIFELEPSLDEGFPSARRRFGDWLDDQHVDPSDAEELSVVLSELVANAVEATPEHLGSATVQVRAWCHDGSISIEVTNEAQQPVEFPSTPGLPEDLLGSRGRGLLIVDAFTEGVQVETVDGRTRVLAVKTLRPPP